VGWSLVIPAERPGSGVLGEIRGGFATAHILTHHFLLYADQETLVRRAEQDPGSNRRWRLEHPAAVLDGVVVAARGS
jgi:hypothetical protein